MIHWFMHWFMKRGRRGALLLGVPMMVSAFIFLNPSGLTQLTDQKEQACPSSARDSDRDGMNDAYELFYGLNSTNPADVLLDYDGDALTNLAESVKLTDPFCEDTDRDGFFDDLDEKISRAYIHWGDPQFTTGDQYEYAHPDWFLGAYKDGGEWAVDLTVTQSCWYVSACGSNGVSSLCVDLDRNILTNNLRYAIHYSEGGSASAVADRAESARSAVLDSSLYVDLLDTNGVIVAEDLFGNLLTGSNTDAIILLNIPTAKIPDAAVIQLRVDRDLRARSYGDIFVYESLLYIDEDGDGLDADQEKQIGTSDYCVDSNNNGTNDYDECFNSGSSTNNPGDVPPPPPPSPGDDDKDKGIIYVDQAIGNDTYTGRSPHISAKKGPKKTVRGGLAIAETNDTIIIRSGNYNENLNIMGKDVKVFIEGKVRL